MKKILVIMVFGVILFSGCANKEDKYKDILKEYSKVYYERYMSGVDNQNQAEISVEMFKVANEYGGEFDLSKLDKCDNETKVTLTLNEKKEIIDYTFDLKCN